MPDEPALAAPRLVSDLTALKLTVPFLQCSPELSASQPRLLSAAAGATDQLVTLLVRDRLRSPGAVPR
jgi:hypothetical protein